jgi:hypothetical protein
MATVATFERDSREQRGEECNDDIPYELDTNVRMHKVIMNPQFMPDNQYPHLSRYHVALGYNYIIRLRLAGFAEAKDEYDNVPLPQNECIEHNYNTPYPINAYKQPNRSSQFMCPSAPTKCNPIISNRFTNHSPYLKMKVSDLDECSLNCLTLLQKQKEYRSLNTDEIIYIPILDNLWNMLVDQVVADKSNNGMIPLRSFYKLYMSKYVYYIFRNMYRINMEIMRTMRAAQVVKLPSIQFARPTAQLTSQSVTSQSTAQSATSKSTSMSE